MRDLEYYYKLPENRRKELRRMYRIFLQMREKGAKPSEFQRLLKYSKIVVRPAYRYYSNAKFECGVSNLVKKYYEYNNSPIEESDILRWVNTLLEERN